MGPAGHSHHKSSDDTVDEKISDNGGSASIPKTVKVPSVWIARTFYTIIILFLGYNARVTSRLEVGINDAKLETAKIAKIVDKLPTQEDVKEMVSINLAKINSVETKFSEIIANLDRRMQVLELWKSETTASRFTLQDGYTISKEMDRMKIDINEKINELETTLASLPDNYPPEWFKNQIDYQLKLLDERVKNLERTPNKSSSIGSDITKN